MKEILNTKEQNVVYPIVKHEFAQINVPKGATNNRFYFPELPNLRDVHLLNLEIPSVDYLPKTPDNKANINNALFQTTFLTLVSYDGKEFCHQIPIQHLIYQSASGTGIDTLLKQFSGQKVNWTKSYVEFADNTLISAVAEEAVIFSIYYAETRKIDAKDKTAFNNKS